MAPTIHTIDFVIGIAPRETGRQSLLGIELISTLIFQLTRETARHGTTVDDMKIGTRGGTIETAAPAWTMMVADGPVEREVVAGLPSVTEITTETEICTADELI